MMLIEGRLPQFDSNLDIGSQDMYRIIILVDCDFYRTSFLAE